MRTPFSVSVLALAIALALSACSQQSTPAAVVSAPSTPSADEVLDESKRLNAWFDQQYAESMQFSPVMLSFYGSKDLNDQLDDASEAGMIKRLAWAEASVKAMESGFNYDALDDATKLSWDLWKRQYEDQRDGMKFFDNRYSFDQMNGMQSLLPMLLINFHKVDNEQDFVAYISRLKQVPRVFDQLLENSKNSAAKGILPPKFALEGVIDQAQKVISGAPFDSGADSALWADLQTKLAALETSNAVTAERALELKAQASSALIESVKPGYDRVIAWHKQELPNALENPAGIGVTHPNGADYYAFQLRQNTTTSMSADEIHELGLKEVARIRGEMEVLKDATGFKGDLQAFFEFLNADKQFKYADTDEGR